MAELSATALYIVHTILWFFHSKEGRKAVVGLQAETGKRMQLAVCLERGERETGVASSPPNVGHQSASSSTAVRSRYCMMFMGKGHNAGANF
jgi:hypothetical protein